MQKLKLSWDTVKDGIDALAYMVSPCSPKLIVGISRGGLIPATLLSHKLNIPMVTITARAYEGTRRTLEKPIRVMGWDPRYDLQSTLVIDDILDSGATIEAIRYNTNVTAQTSFMFASLVNKRPTMNSRNIFFAQVPKDVWVQFPWEQDET